MYNYIYLSYPATVLELGRLMESNTPALLSEVLYEILYKKRKFDYNKHKLIKIIIMWFLQISAWYNR